MNKAYNKYKWITLLSFSFMYNLVYLARFSVTNMIDKFDATLSFTDNQTTLINISVFLSYAIGSFVNGILVDRYDAKRLVALGGILTSLLNITVVFLPDWTLVLICCLVNGFIQSIIWVGGVSLIAQWWPEKDWGKGVGIANFFSGLSHLMAFLLPACIGLLLPELNWKYEIILPILLLLIFVLVFAAVAKEKPESVGLEAYELHDAVRKRNEKLLQSNHWNFSMLVGYIFTRRSFGWWCLIAFLTSVCRYGLFEWGAKYYTGNEHVAFIQSELFTGVALPIGMAFGTLIITWITGSLFLKNKGLMVISMAAICGSMVIVFPFVDNVQSTMIGIFLMGFALYGINGILWLQAIDQGGRIYAGVIAGMLNGCAYLGATIQGFFFGNFIELFHSYIIVFVLIEILCVFIIVCGVMICMNDIRHKTETDLN